MNIINLEIGDIAGIKRLDLSFSPNMNIICGPNGVGKTTILESIGFFYNIGLRHNVKKNVNAESGFLKLYLAEGDQKKQYQASVQSGNPDGHNAAHAHDLELKKLIRFDTDRTFSYARLDTLAKDILSDSSSISLQAASGVKTHGTKNWLAKRYLFSGAENAVSENKKRNLELAKTAIFSLNKNFSFSHVDAGSFDIFVNSPHGLIWYEYLSSGFKSCMSLILGIIREIEHRFDDSECIAESFDGIILIDEIELHLHPDWQSKITSILTSIFPNAQFIITTHSPHVVQNGEPLQIIALESDKEGHVFQRKNNGYEHGFTGWTVDEVLKDIMGMESTLSRSLESKLAYFYECIDEEDYAHALQSYNELDIILHPNNIIRKSLALSLASIDNTDGGESD
ncbi:AAA family ATPase [Rouxiella sp. T17]|uniref:AAA family ATPase n=1 Tax=Rouxiella sp. T17 TaxID=3085684 RepID=UPI002FC8B4CE